jgi:hypothetical protein
MKMAQTAFGRAAYSKSPTCWRSRWRFFDGARRIPARRTSRDRLPSPDPLIDFMKTRDGLALAKAFMQIGSVQLKRRIVDLVEQIEQSRNGPAR